MRLRRLGRRRQDDHLGGDRARHGRSRRQGRRRHDRPRQAAGQRARAWRSCTTSPSRVEPGGSAPRARDPRRAVGDDARPQADFDELIERIAPDPAAGRGDQGQPRLPRALDRRLGLAGVHRDRQALRPRPRGRLRPAGARHAAVAQRDGLPRRARAADLVPRGPRAEGVRPPHRDRHARARPRRGAAAGGAAPDHRHRPARRPLDLLPAARRHDRRLQRPGRAGQKMLQRRAPRRSCS